MVEKASSNKWVLFVLLVVILVMLLAGWLIPHDRWGLNYLVIGGALIVFVATLGVALVGRPGGILINERKLMSLSRFQMVLWTLIILSAYLAMALERIRAGVPNPLDIGIDWHLWALMGISTASLVGTPLVQSSKKDEQPKPDEVQKTAAALGQPADEVAHHSDGILYGNPEVSDAKFTDMFEGDELKNTAYIDLAKVQMFFFTIVAALSYFVILLSAIKRSDPDQLNQFPVLSEGFIAILGISHAGYLTNKSIDHTPTA